MPLYVGPRCGAVCHLEGILWRSNRLASGACAVAFGAPVTLIVRALDVVKAQCDPKAHTGLERMDWKRLLARSESDRCRQPDVLL